MFRQVLQYVTELLNRNVGFLINERFINIPAQVTILKLLQCGIKFKMVISIPPKITIVMINLQITVPLWETLVTEMRKARDRNLPFEFGEPPILTLNLVSHLF